MLSSSVGSRALEVADVLTRRIEKALASPALRELFSNRHNLHEPGNVAAAEELGSRAFDCAPGAVTSSGGEHATSLIQAGSGIAHEPTADPHIGAIPESEPSEAFSAR